MNLAVERFVPHRESMALIDSIVEINQELVHCKSTIMEDNIFYDTEIAGVYAWVGIEFMAQTMAVFVSSQNPQQKPQIGFLISVRNFSSTVPYFRLGERLDIIAHKEFLQQDIGVFQCEIFSKNKLLASAKLNAFQPSQDQVEVYLRGE